MTMNLFIAAPWGLWLCSDFRVCDLHNNKYVPREDHWSPKFMAILTEQKARIVWTYCGVAEIEAREPDLKQANPEQRPHVRWIYTDLARSETVEREPNFAESHLGAQPGTRKKVPVSEWLSWVLSGHATTADQVIQRIATEANGIPEFRRVHHAFTGLLFGPPPLRDAWFLQVTNVDRRPNEADDDPSCWSRSPRTTFQVLARRVDDPPIVGWGALGSGALYVTTKQRTRIRDAKDHKPRKPRDFMNMLASLNAEIAGVTSTVSPACQVVFMYPNPGSGKPGFLEVTYPNGQQMPADFTPAIRLNMYGADQLAGSRAFIRGVRGT